MSSTKEAPKRKTLPSCIYGHLSIVMRAFVRLRELAISHADLAKRLDELEHKTEGLALAHDTFSRNTRNQLKQVFDTLRELMVSPDPPKRPIGFVTPEDKSSTKDTGRGKTLIVGIDLVALLASTFDTGDDQDRGVRVLRQYRDLTPLATRSILKVAPSITTFATPVRTKSLASDAGDPYAE